MIFNLLFTTMAFPSNKQQELIYLQEGESFIVLNSVKYAEKFNEQSGLNLAIQQINIDENNDLLIEIDQLNLKDCSNITSIKYLKQEQFTETQVLYETNQGQSLFQQYSQSFIRFENNQAILSSVVFINTINITLNLQKCYDFQFFKIDYLFNSSYLYLICYSEIDNSYQLIQQDPNNEQQYIFNIDLSIQKNECDIHLELAKVEILYLIICLNTEKWALYTIRILNNDLHLELNDFRLQLNNELLCLNNIECKPLIISGYEEQKNSLILYNMDITLPIEINYFQILRFYKPEIRINFDIQKSIYINTELLQTKQMKYLRFDKTKIIFNNSHLIINNMYKKQKIDFLNYWSNMIISIVFNNEIKIFQINPLASDENIIIMKKNKINLQLSGYSQQKQILFENGNINQTQHFYEQFLCTIEKYGEQSFLSEQIFLPLFEFQLKSKIKNQNTQLKIESQQYLTDFSNNQLKFKYLLYFFTNSHQSLWLIKRNDWLYLEVSSHINSTNQPPIILYQILIQNDIITWKFFLHVKFMKIYIVIQEQDYQTHIIIIKLLDNYQYIIETYNLYQLKEIVQDFQVFNDIQYISTNTFVYQINQSYNQLSPIEKFQLNKFGMVNNNYIQYQNNHTLIITGSTTNSDNLNSKNLNINILLAFQLEDPNIDDNQTLLLICGNGQFILILSSKNQVSFLHYYVTNDNLFILVKSIQPQFQIIIKKPYCIKQAQFYFSIEAYDQHSQENVLLLYDISLSLMLTLRYKTPILSNEYIITNNGEIIFIFDQYIHIISTDKFRIDETITDFFKQETLNQQIEILLQPSKYTYIQNKQFEIQYIIDIIYKNHIQDIILNTEKLKINFFPFLHNYQIDIQNIANGIIQKVESTQYKIIEPVSIIQSFTKEKQTIVQISNNLVILATQELSKIQITFFIITDVQNHQPNLKELHNYLYITNYVLDKIFILKQQQKTYIIVVISEIIQYKLAIFTLVDNVISEPSFQLINQKSFKLIQFQNKIVFINQFSLDIYEIYDEDTNYIGFTQFYIKHEPGMQFYAESQDLFGCFIYNSRMHVQILDLKQLIFTPLFNFSISVNLIQQLKIVLISKVKFSFLYQQQDLDLYYYNWNQQQQQLQKFTLFKFPFFILGRTFYFNDILIIEYQTLTNNQYFLFNLQIQFNEKILYPIQKLEFPLNQAFEICNSRYLFVSSTNFSIVEMAKNYQLRIDNLNAVNFEIFISNSYITRIVQVSIAQPIQYLILICIFCISYNVIVMKIKNKKTKSYSKL